MINDELRIESCLKYSNPKEDVPLAMHLKPTPLSKALEINQDLSIYGTFAEIGAGQEVARFFFQAGKASQTIAKTMSAYDMNYSDEIYGREKSGRYVCESRLNKMLDKEFSLLIKRLDPTRGDKTQFFAFANTVATGDLKKKYSHGWMGVRFQKSPRSPANDIVIHVRLLDQHRLLQQEALGILGVNLMHCAFRHISKPDEFLIGLLEGLKSGQVMIDMIKVSGPGLSHFNNHLLNLQLVKKGYAEAVLFGPDREILNISDEVYGKSLMVQRGMFRPVTITHVDVFQKGKAQFEKEQKKKSPILCLCELNMETLTEHSGFSEQDFLDRIDCLSAINMYVLVTNFTDLYETKDFLRRHTDRGIVIIMGASYLDRTFDESHYKNLTGGILEGMGKLISDNSRIFIYPHKTTEICITADTYNPKKDFAPIYRYLTENKFFQGISGCEESGEYVHSRYVGDLILKGDSRWKKLVPQPVRELIEKKKYFKTLNTKP